jgi:hypothetical protein
MILTACLCFCANVQIAMSVYGFIPYKQLSLQGYSFRSTKSRAFVLNIGVDLGGGLALGCLKPRFNSYRCDLSDRESSGTSFIGKDGEFVKLVKAEAHEKV